MPVFGEVLEELIAHEGSQVVVCSRRIVVEAALHLGRSPAVPLELAADDRLVRLPVELGPVPPLGLEVVEVLEEENPGSLLDVVQFVADPFLSPEDALDAVEGALVHPASLTLHN